MMKTMRYFFAYRTKIRIEEEWMYRCIEGQSLTYDVI